MSHHVLESVKHAPVPIPLATPPLVVTYLDLVGMININAYSPIDGYPYVAATIRAIETMNRYQGLTAGFEAGELFMTYRSVGVDDLMRWASPAHARG